jgi:hypothetical protein
VLKANYYPNGDLLDTVLVDNGSPNCGGQWRRGVWLEAGACHEVMSDFAWPDNGAGIRIHSGGGGQTQRSHKGLAQQASPRNIVYGLRESKRSSKTHSGL